QRLEHPFLPETRDQPIGRIVAAVDEYCADKRLAHVGQYRGPASSARMGLGISELEHRAEVHRTSHLRAGFLAHQIGKTPRQFPLIRLRKGAVQHVGYDETKNVIAEKFESLIAGNAVAAR